MVYLPDWMIAKLRIKEGDPISVILDTQAQLDFKCLISKYAQENEANQRRTQSLEIGKMTMGNENRLQYATKLKIKMMSQHLVNQWGKAECKSEITEKVKVALSHYKILSRNS